MIAVRKGLDDKFQHTLLDQEIKDGRIANEEIAKECFESRKFFIDLRERTGQTLNWETKQAYIAMTALLYGAAFRGGFVLSGTAVLGQLRYAVMLVFSTFFEREPFR